MSKDIIESTVEAYIERYGIEKNLVVLVEELAELQQAICKYLRHSETAVIRKDKSEIIDDVRNEVADVLYCMHYLCGITNNEWKDCIEFSYDKAIENKKRFENKS